MSGNAILSDDELAAAFAEIENAGDGDTIPNLDDGSEPDKQSASPVVAVAMGKAPTFKDAVSDGVVDEWSQVVADDDFTSPEAVAEQQAKESEPPAAPPWYRRIQIRTLVQSLANGVYDTLDYALAWANRPMSRLNEQIKSALVWSSVVTIGLSILVIFLAPLVIRTKTATEFLQEKKSSLRSATIVSQSGDKP
jgi:hypothetical protein